LNVAVEAAIPFAAEKTQDVLGGKRHGRELNELLIEPCERGGAFEDEIAGELGLIDDPADVVSRQLLAQQRVDLVGVAIEDFGPVEFGEPIRLTLGFGRFIELGKGVVLDDKAQAKTDQLLGEPVVAVRVDLECERRPGLQTDMDQAQLRVEEIVVKNALLPRPGHKLRPLLAGNEGERVAGFLSAEDADEAFFDAMFAKESFRPRLFFEGAGAIQIRSPRLASDVLGVLNEGLGELRSDDVHEMATPHLEGPIDEFFELGQRRHGQMSLEDHAVETMQRANNKAGKLGDEAPYCIHGILPRLADISTNHSGGRMPYLLQNSVCGSAALR
jgi:hypothetical protein